MVVVVDVRDVVVYGYECCGCCGCEGWAVVVDVSGVVVVDVKT